MKTKKTTRPKPKTRRTSDRVSSAAARMLSHFRGKGWPAELLDNIFIMGVNLRELRAMAASCVNQDQHRGLRGNR